MSSNIFHLIYFVLLVIVYLPNIYGSHCEEGDKIPSILRCVNYFLCENGKFVKQSCSVGKWYDGEKRQCRNKDLVQCVAESSLKYELPKFTTPSEENKRRNGRRRNSRHHRRSKSHYQIMENQKDSYNEELKIAILEEHEVQVLRFSEEARTTAFPPLRSTRSTSVVNTTGNEKTERSLEFTSTIHAKETSTNIIQNATIGISEAGTYNVTTSTSGIMLPYSSVKPSSITTLDDVTPDSGINFTLVGTTVDISSNSKVTQKETTLSDNITESIIRTTSIETTTFEYICDSTFYPPVTSGNNTHSDKSEGTGVTSGLLNRTIDSPPSTSTSDVTTDNRSRVPSENSTGTGLTSSDEPFNSESTNFTEELSQNSTTNGGTQETVISESTYLATKSTVVYPPGVSSTYSIWTTLNSITNNDTSSTLDFIEFTHASNSTDGAISELISTSEITSSDNVPDDFTVSKSSQSATSLTESTHSSNTTSGTTTGRTIVTSGITSSDHVPGESTSNQSSELPTDEFTESTNVSNTTNENTSEQSTIISERTVPDDCTFSKSSDSAIDGTTNEQGMVTLEITSSGHVPGESTINQSSELFTEDFTELTHASNSTNGTITVQSTLTTDSTSSIHVSDESTISIPSTISIFPTTTNGTTTEPSAITSEMTSSENVPAITSDSSAGTEFSINPSSPTNTTEIDYSETTNFDDVSNDYTISNSSDPVSGHSMVTDTTLRDGTTTQENTSPTFSESELPTSKTTASTEKPSTPTIPSFHGGCRASCPTNNEYVAYIPHVDCTKFCQCEWGYAHIINCPPGLYFNPSINVCDWPRNSGCIPI